MNWDDCLKRRWKIWNLHCCFDKNKTLPSFSFIVHQLPPFIAVGGQLLPTGYQTNKTWSWPTSPCEMPSFSFFLSRTIKPGHGQHILVTCLHCLYTICLVGIAYRYYTDDTGMSVSASKQKEGQFWVTAWNTGAPVVQIKHGKFNIFFLFLVAIWWDATISCICLCIYFQQKRSALLHFILHESWRPFFDSLF